MELLEYNEKNKSYLSTGNAILLFEKSPRNKFLQAVVKAKVHNCDDKIGAEPFNDALVLISDQIEEWLKKVLQACIDRSKLKCVRYAVMVLQMMQKKSHDYNLG